MKRAAVCIGVAKRDGLPKLKVACQGAKDVHEWALANGIDSYLFTDDEGEGSVTVDQPKKKIKELIKPSNLDQLIIYFSGHGWNIRRQEYWLLSGDEEDDQAVNLAEAEMRARYCGVPHVVFLSDACRTPPPDTQTQSIAGDPLFPNSDYEGPENQVDIFWACTLGTPSLEIKDPNDSAKRHAVFTDVLLAALKGTYRDILQPEPPSFVLRPRPLHKLLADRVPARIADLLKTPVKQRPDARISSDETAWLARFDNVPLAGPAPKGLRTRSMKGIAPPKPAAAPPPSATTVAREAAERAVSDPSAALLHLGNSAVPEAHAIAGAVVSEAAPEGPDHFETMCGFKIRGAKVRNATAGRSHVDVFDSWLVRVGLPVDRCDNVLFELEDGRAIVLPAIPYLIATLSFSGGELRNVAYEPSANSPLWADYAQKKGELTVMRSLIAASADIGGFRLEGADAETLTERIRFLKGLDPTMALYAAYSYHNLGGKRDELRKMQEYLREGLEGATLFDVAMLADFKVDMERTVPFVPMLSQGWSLVGAVRGVPPEIAELRKYVGPSLWTVFDEGALPTLRQELMK